MSKLQDLLRMILKSPVLWGCLAAALFYGLVYKGPLATPIIVRYFTHHPVEYMETVLFAIGMAALVLRGINVAGQQVSLQQPLVGPMPKGFPGMEERCRPILERLGRLPHHRQDDYYPRRLRAAMEYVLDRGSGEGLSDELKYLAERDVDRLQNGYALFNVVIWAVPILGFLGTVIGITMALNALDPKHIEESMMKVTTGLGVKFDTTALALAMAMVLMFSYFFVHRWDSVLLDEVDRRVGADLAHRFPQVPSGGDGPAVAMGQQTEPMLRAVQRLVEQQAALWKSSLEAAEGRWGRMAAAVGDQFQRALSEALDAGLRQHAERLTAAEQIAAEENRRHWDKVQQTHAQHIEAMAALQAELAREAEFLARAIEATGEVTRLQDALNRNLASLGGAKHIEQTVLGLAAAIHLLDARLAGAPAEVPPLEAGPHQRAARAA